MYFILDHNSHVPGWILKLLVSMERGMNALHRSYKIYNFTLTVSLHYLKQIKNTCIQQHILKSVVTVFYYSAAECVYEVSELFFTSY